MGKEVFSMRSTNITGDNTNEKTVTLKADSITCEYFSDQSDSYYFQCADNIRKVIIENLQAIKYDYFDDEVNAMLEKNNQALLDSLYLLQNVYEEINGKEKKTLM